MIDECDEDYKLLSDNSSYSVNKDNENCLICRDCLEDFTLCTICNGYFEKEIYSCHQTLCKQIYKLYEKEENLVECNICRSLIKFEEYADHQDRCKLSVKYLETSECNYCKTLVELVSLYDHEKECQTILTDLLLIEETYQCSYCKNQISLKEFYNHEKICKKQTLLRHKIQRQIDIFEMKFPDEWGKEIESCEVIDDNLSIITITKETQYKYVSNMIEASKFKIDPEKLKIFRIENKNLWSKYDKEKVKILEEKNEASEQMLFHGTKGNDPKILINHGFDISFSQDKGSFGRGIYFAKYFLYSHQGYSYNKGDKKYLFLARVITGKSYFSPHGVRYKKPPLLDKQKEIYYDSVTNNLLSMEFHNLSHMYIVYENDKAYPFYLIEYS